MSVLGYTLFVKNIKKNICEGILIAFVLLCVSGLTAMFYYERSKLNVTAKLKGDNVYYFENANVEDMIFYENTGKMKGIKDELTVGSITTAYKSYYNDKEIYENVKLLGYDSRIYKQFMPLLSEGIWLDKTEKYDDCIPAVITKENAGLSLNDVFKLEGVEYEFRVHGIIKDGAEILCNGDTYDILNDNYNCLYEAAYYDVDNAFYVLVRNEDIANRIELNASIKTFVSFGEMSEKEMNDNLLYMSQNGHYITLEDFNKKGNSLFQDLLLSFTPTVSLIIIIIGFSFALMTMIAYRENARYLSVCYVVGMAWPDYIRIMLAERCITYFGGILLAVSIHIVVYMKKGNAIYLTFGCKELIWCAAILSIMFLAQIAVSAAMFFKFSPKESLRVKGEMVW